MEAPKDFRELVTWATWQVMEGITRGERLESVMHGVLMSAVQFMKEWRSFAPQPAQAVPEASWTFQGNDADLFDDVITKIRHEPLSRTQQYAQLLRIAQWRSS